MQQGRYKLVGSVVMLSDGRIVVAGGAAQPEVLDLATGRAERVHGSLGAVRLFLTATPIDGERVLLLGGYDERIRPTDQAWIVG